ncbi:MAG: cytochrome P450 [Chloroflexota bacterium]
MTIAVEKQARPVPIKEESIISALLSGAISAPIKPFENNWRELGDFYYYQVRNFPVSIISHPKYAQEVLIRQRDVFQKMGKSPRGDVLALVLGDGLITNHDTDSWLSQRRMMQPMFHRKRLASLSEKMVDGGQRMLDRWSKLSPGATVDINDEMMLVTMDIISQSLFSSDVMNDAGRVGSSVTEALHFAFSRRGLFTFPLSWPLPAHRRFRKAMTVIDEVVYNFIDQRQGHEHEFDDLLSMLMEARDEETGEAMSRLQLRDEVASFFGAGHETTSHALTWTLYLLTQNPEAMKKLQDEVDTVLNGRLPTFNDLPNLPYTKMVFEEGMRLFPPVPLLPRYAMEETEIDGFRVPENTIGLISIWNIHRHPDIWEDPLAFKPERFAPELSKARHRMSFMPFGGGQRMCIGNNFALYEGQMLLAMMVQNYQFELQEGFEPVLDLAITLQPKTGMPMKVYPR